MRDFQITPMGILIVILCVGLLFVLITPAILISREESRGITCQSHQTQLVLQLREQHLLSSLADPSIWPATLAESWGQAMTDEHCPSDNRQPRPQASYGINALVSQFGEGDAYKITFLDFDSLVVALTDGNIDQLWRTSVAPRHFDLVNVAFYDTHVEARNPMNVAPSDKDIRSVLWIPQTVTSLTQ